MAKIISFPLPLSTHWLVLLAVSTLVLHTLSFTNASSPTLLLLLLLALATAAGLETGPRLCPTSLYHPLSTRWPDLLKALLWQGVRLSFHILRELCF